MIENVLHPLRDALLIFDLVVKPFLQSHQSAFDGIAVHPEIAMPGVDISATHPTYGFSVELELKSVSLPLFICWLSAKTILNPPCRGVVHQANNCIKPLRRGALQEPQERPFPIHRRIAMPPIGEAKIFMKTRSIVVGVRGPWFLNTNREQYFSRHIGANGNQAVQCDR